MFDIWKSVDNDLSTKIVSYQKDYGRENIDATKIKVEECFICPYEGYHFLRLIHVADHRIEVEQQRRYEIKEGTISYLIAKYDIDGLLVELIPLHSNSETLYAINKRLGLKLTRETVLPYLVFYGLVVASNEGSFYFVSNINHLETIRSHLAETPRQTLDGIIRGSFGIDDTGNLAIDVAQKRYPILGSAFKLTIPLIYAGAVYKTDIRISESGIPDMDDDEPTTIQGLDDKLPISQRYALEFSPGIATTVGRNRAKNAVIVGFLNFTLGSERIVSILLLPAYLLSMLIVVLLGVDSEVVYKYYNELNSVGFLNWMNLIIGAILLLFVVMRFLVMELAAATEKLVPNQLSHFFYALSNIYVTAKNKLGVVLFLILVAIEFILGTFLALNLFIYGVSNTSIFSFVYTGLNFIEVVFMIFFSIPGVVFIIDSLFGIGDKIGFYFVLKDGFLVYLSSTLISTITVGLLIRIFRMSNK